jgi:hypothetical protein
MRMSVASKREKARPLCRAAHHMLSRSDMQFRIRDCSSSPQIRSTNQAKPWTTYKWNFSSNLRNSWTTKAHSGRAPYSLKWREAGYKNCKAISKSKYLSYFLSTYVTQASHFTLCGCCLKEPLHISRFDSAYPLPHSSYASVNKRLYRDPSKGLILIAILPRQRHEFEMLPIAE